MPWFKVDDGFATSRKVLMIPRRYRCQAVGLWTLAGSWAAKELTDGFVPSYVLEEVASTVTVANRLVEVNLWEKGPGGFHFVNWGEYQPTKSEVDASRATEAERKRKWREAKKAKADTRAEQAIPKNVPPGQAGDKSVRPAGVPPSVRTSSALPDPTRPDPTRPQGIEETPSPQTAKPKPPPGFDKFWQTYPRRQGKQDAIKAYAKAIKTVDAHTIIAAAQSFANDPNRDPAFTAMPATWLNGGRWDDDPVPNRNTGPAQQQMTPRQKRMLETELLKENPDPRALALAGIQPNTRQMEIM